MTAKKRVTMKDIAGELGVHQTTVSLALRNDPSLPLKTREMIHQKARELGYVPDPMLSSLVAYRGRSKEPKTRPTIGYVMDLRGESQLELDQPRSLFLKGARDRADELGYKLDVFYFGSGQDHSRALDRILYTRRINGLIIAAFTHKTDLRLNWDAYSVMKIEVLPVDLRFNVIENNQMQVTRLAVEKMREKGYRRIGMIVGEHDEAHTRNLFTAGYLVAQNQLPPADRLSELIIKGRDLDAELPEIIKWLETQNVEVLITNWNELTPYLERIRKALSRDLPFVSLDLDHYAKGRMGVVQNHEAVGAYAVEQVGRLMRNNERGMVECPSIHLVDGFWRDGTEGAEEQSPEVNPHIDQLDSQALTRR